MSEQIRVLDRNAPAIIIFEAMVKKVAKDDLLKHFTLKPNGDDSVANVEMMVNGKSVPVMETLLHYFKQFDAEVESRAQELVKEMTSSLALGRIRSSLERIEHEVDTAETAVKANVKDWFRTNGEKRL